MAAQKNNNETLMKLVYPPQAYDKIFENATFSFYGAFGTMDDFVMRDEVELLHQICEENGFKWFKTAIKMGREKQGLKKQQTKSFDNVMVDTPTKEHFLDLENIHYSKFDPSKPVEFPTVKERFDNIEFLKANCPKGSTIFICGPPIMNTSVYKNLRDIGFEDYDIYLV